jgi:hypothetical protein
MDGERAKQVARDYFERLPRERDLGVVDELLAPDYVDHDAPPGTPPGPEATKAFIGALLAHHPDLQKAIDAALADAANRLGVPRAQLRAARVERREWPDASLGCPQPGMMYAQVITPGYLVVVAGASKQLEYHTDTRGRAVFCRES